MSYVGTADKSVTCIYGNFTIKEGQEVPMLIAVKFPQFVKQVKDHKPKVEVVGAEPVVEEIISEDKLIKEKGKKQNDNV